MSRSLPVLLAPIEVTRLQNPRLMKIYLFPSSYFSYNIANIQNVSNLFLYFVKLLITRDFKSVTYLRGIFQFLIN